MTKQFVETYKKRLEKICLEANQDLVYLPRNALSQTEHIHSMLKKVVEVSMQGLQEQEKDWILQQYMGDYINQINE